MNQVFRFYGILFPYILFINVLSFGSKSLGIGTLLFVASMFTLVIVTALFACKVKVHGLIFLGLASFAIINLVKYFVYNSGGMDFSFMLGGIGNWVFFLLNFIFSVLYFKNSEGKMKFIRMLSYVFILSSLIGVFHYYFFYNIPFMDPSYGTDEAGTIFNVADYDLMRFRESSIFFGANVNAYMTVMGYLFLVFSLIKKGIVGMFKSPVYWFGLIIHCWNIFISDSRSGILLIILLTLVLLYDKRVGINLNLPGWARVLILLVLISGLFIYVQNQPRLQLSVLLTDERFIKISLGITILLNAPLNIFIGAPLNDKWTIGEVSVSDNMYIAILLYVGIIGLFLLALTTIYIFKSLNKLLSNGIDYHYTLLAKYLLILFLLIGIFSIPIGMMPFMIYFGIILGGVQFGRNKEQFS